MDEFSSPYSKRSKVIRVVGTLVAVILLIYLFITQGWGDILAGISKIPIWLLLITLVLTFISRLAVTGRWYILLKSAGLQISAYDSLRITFAGLFAANFLPTTIGGDVIRLTGVIRLKFDAAVCTTSLVVDRLVGMAGMAMVLPFCLPALQSIRQTSWQTPLLRVLLFTAPVNNLLGSIREKSRRSIKKIYSAMGLWLKNPRSLFISLTWSWVHMLCVFAILWLLLLGLGDAIPIWLIGGLYSLVYFFTLIPISINGYGLQEVSMTFVFYQLGGVSLSSSLTTALLFRTLMVIGSLPGAFFFPRMLAPPDIPVNNTDLN